jgi:anthranilate phosphoribosyltransferase
MNNKQLLEKIFTQKDLSSEEIQFLLSSILKGDLHEVQIAAFLVGLRMKGETTEEIYGLIQGMRKYMITIPTVANAIDTCGTGGDGSGTFNISTIVALVVAGAGVPVIKHGNKAASSLCGSADVLAQLGVHIILEPKYAKIVLEKVGMVFLFAPFYHPAMKYIAPVRKALGTRTVFNFLGPFLSPGNVRRQLIGVPDIIIAEKLATVAKHLEYEHLMIATSASGLDEIDCNGTTELFEIKKDKISRQTIDPKKFSFKNTPSDALQGGSIEENAKIIHRILSGEKGPKRDIVMLNSAYAMLVAGRAKTVSKGIELANEAIDSGAAKRVLENLVKETQKYAE